MLEIHNRSKMTGFPAFNDAETSIYLRKIDASDKELIGHEIAHVIQQREGKVSAGIDKDPSLEAKAQLEGQNFASGTKVRGKRAMLEPKKASTETIQRKELSDSSGTSKDWNNRLFSANLMGSEDNRRVDFTLDRTANKITGSFAIHGTGRGNITKGEFNPADKASPEGRVVRWVNVLEFPWCDDKQIKPALEALK
jgi:hypothetical protein